MNTPVFCKITDYEMFSDTVTGQLWFLFKPRINLSPFTKDFRGEEHV